MVQILPHRAVCWQLRQPVRVGARVRGLGTRPRHALASLFCVPAQASHRQQAHQCWKHLQSHSTPLSCVQVNPEALRAKLEHFLSTHNIQHSYSKSSKFGGCTPGAPACSVPWFRCRLCSTYHCRVLARLRCARGAHGRTRIPTPPCPPQATSGTRRCCSRMARGGVRMCCGQIEVPPGRVESMTLWPHSQFS